MSKPNAHTQNWKYVIHHNAVVAEGPQATCIENVVQFVRYETDRQTEIQT